MSVGSLGAALDAFLNPIYKDSILAHMSVPLLLRVAKQGWGHYLETTSTNVTQAYTAASVMDLRARRRETDPDISFTLEVANASPWLIGDNGFGHWWLGDRVGGTSKYLMPRVFVRRNRELTIDWGDGKGVTIAGKFADTRNAKDAIEKLPRLAKNYAGSVIGAAERAEETLTVKIQAIRIGDLAVCGIPFETFVETGLDLKKRSPFPQTMVIGLANGRHGYLPTPEQHLLGGYETWLGTNVVQEDTSVMRGMG